MWNRGMRFKNFHLVTSLASVVSSSAFCGSRNFATHTVPVQLPNGLCAVYKPKGCSSNHVVMKVKHIFGKKVKVGHGGTLDPMAEGVLVLGLGAGTKQLGTYLSGSKGYKAIGLLGKSFDTLDVTGEQTGSAEYNFVTQEILNTALSTFRGEIRQMPPMYSALKVQGKKLYELARAGIEVERELRDVTVYNLNLMEGRQLPEFGLDIECSGGFYVRSLIADLAAEVGTLGCMSELIRTKQAMFTVEDCLVEGDWTPEKLYAHTQKCNEIVQMRK